MGRPNGEKNMIYSLESIAPILSKHLGKDVEFVNDCIGQHVVDVNYYNFIYDLLYTRKRVFYFILEKYYFNKLKYYKI